MLVVLQKEVDTRDDPTALTLISCDAIAHDWKSSLSSSIRNPKSAIRNRFAPGQPRTLEATLQGPTTVFLDWKPPARGTGGAVRSYIVQRRDQPAGGGEPGPWKQIATALESEITVVDQPRGIQMEYQIIAINTGGQSMPSNIAAVVL